MNVALRNNLSLPSVLAVHVVHRGYRRRPVFKEDGDAKYYLELLTAELGRGRLSLLSYCILSNHVHLVVTPAAPEVCGLVRKLHQAYGRYFHRKYGSRTLVWSGRWLQKPLDFIALWYVVRYVELNPVRAGVVVRAEDYPYSSARAHVLGRDERGVLDLKAWGRLFGDEKWGEELKRWEREQMRGQCVSRYLGRFYTFAEGA